LLDENKEAQGHDYFDIALFDVTPITRSSRVERHRWQRALHDTRPRPRHRYRSRRSDDEHIMAGGAWSKDNRHYFYVSQTT